MKYLALFTALVMAAACTPKVEDPDVEVFKAKGGKVEIACISHGSLAISYKDYSIQIDPVKNYGGKVIDYESYPKADLILVTHDHFDHYDEATLRLLSKENTRLIMNQTCVKKFGNGTAMKNGDKEILSDDITVEAVAAYNTTEGHQQYHPKGRDNGYILTLDGLRIYIAGDTEVIPEMDAIKDIDIAFLPCNQPYTMTPDQLVKAARKVNPIVLFPYHYSDTDVSGIAAQLEGIDVRIRHYE